MRIKAVIPFVLMIFLLLSSCGVKQVKDKIAGWIGDDTPKSLETSRLSFFEYEDKLMGAWAGKMIGVSYSAPYEFKYLGQMMDEGLIREWSPEFVMNSLEQDDLYVQMTFLQVIDEKGFQISGREAADYFAKTEYPLWHANDIGRQNIRAGIFPPDSGHPRYNPHANDIDFQIEADVFGILCPGMPRSAVKMAEPFGRMMNYGDGLYGGLFVAAMYSTAYFENTRVGVIEQGLKCIPKQSQYAQVIRDVLNYFGANPTDWQGCWKMLQDKWGETDLCPDGYGKPFNIDAKLNGGYVVLGLLYGEGDFAKTMEITTRCGQDNDCNVSTAAGILGVLNGYSRIPHQYKVGIPLISNRRFLHTQYNFTTLIQTCRTLTTNLIKQYGGNIKRLGEREYFQIPVQTPETPKKLEQFTDEMRLQYQDNWSVMETERKARFRNQVKESFSTWKTGWVMENCGDEMSPGLRKTYAGHYDVFVTHPKDQETPCVLTFKGILEAEKPVLHIVASHSIQDPEADWILRVRVNGDLLKEETIGVENGKIKWYDLRYDLSAYAGQEITLQLENAADEWKFEAAYWGIIEFVKK